MKHDQKITLQYLLTGLIAVAATWFVHEFAHWLTSEWLGYDTVMTLNKTHPSPGVRYTEAHSVLVSATGPIITVLQGLCIFSILRSGKWNKYLYLFLFTPFYMRFLAGLMNFISINDEGRISAYLGIGTFTLPLIVSGLLFFMVYKTSKTYRLTGRFQLGTTLMIMVFSSILILADQFYGFRLL